MGIQNNTYTSASLTTLKPLSVWITSDQFSSATQSCLTLCDPMDCTACQALLLSMGFSRQGYWSGLPFPTPGDLPDLGIKPTSPVSLALAG